MKAMADPVPNSERYVVALRRAPDTSGDIEPQYTGALRTHAFFTLEEANKFAENKRAEVSFDTTAAYSLVTLWDVEHPERGGIQYHRP